MNYKYILVAIIIIALFSTGVSISRNISDQSDDVYTKIQNSNGKYWEATSANIQVAINDLDNNSGTVWLPGNKTFYLTTTLIVWKNVMLDMGGAEFRLPTGVNTNVVELKDGSGIKNGVINVAGWQTGTYTTNTSFATPNACILLNATSCIKSATIEEMHLESISAGYYLGTPFYDANHYGAGYGIYLHATNATTLQEISFVSVNKVLFRSFRIAIYLSNERNAVSGNGAYIQYNVFSNLVFQSCSWGVNLTRTANNSRCITSYNYFNQLHWQTGDGSYWGGEYLAYGVLNVSGTGNFFKNIIIWDFTNNNVGGSVNSVHFASDSDHNFIHTPCFNDNYFSDNGTYNIYWNTAAYWATSNTLLIGKVTELGIPDYGTLYERNLNMVGVTGEGSGGNVWISQTFTIGNTGDNVTHNITYFGLYLNIFNASTLPGIITLEIMAVNETGIPTGANISWGTTDGDTLPQGGYGGEHELRIINMTACELVAGTQYAIEAHSQTGLFVVQMSDSYTGGMARYSYDSGATWGDWGGIYDLIFYEYGS